MLDSTTPHATAPSNNAPTFDGPHRHDHQDDRDDEDNDHRHHHDDHDDRPPRPSDRHPPPSGPTSDDPYMTLFARAPPPQVTGKAKLQEVTSLLERLRTDLKEKNLFPPQRNGLLEHLKILGREPENADPLYTKEVWTASEERRTGEGHAKADALVRHPTRALRS